MPSPVLRLGHSWSRYCGRCRERGLGEWRPHGSAMSGRNCRIASLSIETRITRKERPTSRRPGCLWGEATGGPQTYDRTVARRLWTSRVTTRRVGCLPRRWWSLGTMRHAAQPYSRLCGGCPIPQVSSNCWVSFCSTSSSRSAPPLLSHRRAESPSGTGCWTPSA